MAEKVSDLYGRFTSALGTKTPPTQTANGTSSQNNTMTITNSEFSQMQEQLLSLKQQIYEGKQREQKHTAEVARLKKIEQEFQKLNRIMNQSKDKQAMMDALNETEQLRRTIEVMNNEHREQNEALRNNIQHMYKQQSEMQQEIDNIKGEKDRLQDRIVEMKKRELEFSQFRERTDRLLRQSLSENSSEKCTPQTDNNQQENESCTETSVEDPAKKALNELVISLYNQLFPNNTDFQNVGVNTSASNNEMEAKDNSETSEESDAKKKQVAPANNIPSMDQDLLNNITRLEQQLQEQQKKFETEKDNLEQQLQVWKEKTRMKQERVQDMEQEQQAMEKELSKLKNTEIELKENVSRLEEKLIQAQQQIEKMKAENESVLSKLSEREQERRNFMQQTEELTLKQEKMANLVASTQRQLTSASEMREQFRREVVEANRKIKQLEPFVEKANRFDQLEQAHQVLVERNQALQKQYQELQTQEAALLNTRDSLHEQLKKMESRSKTLQSDIDRLVQEKQELIDRAKEYVHEMSERESQKESTIKQLRTRLNQFERGQEKSDETMVHYFVSQTLAQWSDRLVSHELAVATQELLEAREKIVELSELSERSTRERDELQQQLKDKRTEYLLQLKKSKQVAQELRNQVTQLQSQLKAMETNDIKLGAPVSLVRQRSFDHSIAESPRPSLTRVSSSISMTSPNQNNSADAGKRLSISSDTSISDIIDQQIVKENNLLVQRVADLQNAKWTLEERCRLLDESLMLLKEELEKKQDIIQYYISREKIGRINPEQERFNQAHQPKGLAQSGSSVGGGFMGLFSSNKKGSKQQVTPTVDAYNHMQQVMQETLLHNIQLQKDIKTLGDEIARLLNEKRQLEAEKKVV